MKNILSIQNDYLCISVNQIGAELCSIKDKSGTEYMWNADPGIWQGHAPILFPIVGALKENTFYFNKKLYELPQHGFVRNNNAIKLVEQKTDKLTFCLEANAETLKSYPFKFALFTTYKLDKKAITISHKVENKEKSPMYFSIGAHPAFKCPVNNNEEYSDYYIELEKAEKAYTHKITKTGLIGDPSDLILDMDNIINLEHSLFEKGALVFKNLKSKKACLVSKRTGKILEISFNNFPYLGIWAKTTGNYVCIEPWQGIADSINSNQDITQKEGIIKLEGLSEYETMYSIEIFQSDNY